MQKKVCFIGAGNLATHLARELHKVSFDVIQVFSRSKESAQTLANRIGANYTTSVEHITKEADLYFIALKDSIIHEVLEKIDFRNKLIVHCSGSLSLSVIESYSENIGVFYPLQTFSKKREVRYKEIPVFIEANNVDNERFLVQVADTISDKVSVLDSDRRKKLHVSAVLGCNFVNHFYTLAADYLKAHDISFEHMHPLIQETASKAQEMHPFEAQTGPAVRFDRNIIEDHLNQLKDFPELKELYNSISRSIFERHQKS